MLFLEKLQNFRLRKFFPTIFVVVEFPKKMLRLDINHG